MCADVKDRILRLVRVAIDEKLAGLKNEIASIQSDVGNRLGEISSQLSQEAIRLPEGQIEEMVLESRRAPDEGPLPKADLSVLRDGVAAIQQGTSQVSILQEMLRKAYSYCSRCALFVVREQSQNMIGWAALGFTGCGDMPDAGIKKVSLSLDQDSVLNAVYKSGSPFNGSTTQHQDNMQLFEMIGSLDPVEIMVAPLFKAGRVAAVLYADSGDSQEGLGSAEAIDILTRATGMSIDLIPLKQKLAARGKPLGAAAPAQPAVEGQQEAEAYSAPPRPEAAAQPEWVAPAPEAPAQPEGEVPSPEPVAAPEPPPVPSALGPEEAKAHEEAKRFARLLVSEVKLYNEAKVVEGRKNKDVYSRLKDDIERSRQMYNERYPDISKATDYFDQELIATLAEGDPSALGI